MPTDRCTSTFLQSSPRILPLDVLLAFGSATSLELARFSTLSAKVKGQAHHSIEFGVTVTVALPGFEESIC